MARIIVTPDDARTVLLDEKEVRPGHLNDERSAMQLLERLEWAIRDAERRRIHTSRPPRERARIFARQSALERTFD